jgi:TrkA domain protein
MVTPRLRATPLPGIGVRYELHTGARDALSVVTHRDGGRTLNVHHDEDPDSCGVSLRLAANEATALASVLVPDHDSPSLLHAGDFGLMAERIGVAGTSYWNGRALGETRLRTRTGASIVAVLRRSHASPSPGPRFRLRGGDVLIVIGTRDGVDEAHTILERT